MLENNFEFTFFLKSSKKNIGYIYLRVRIDVFLKKPPQKENGRLADGVK